MNLDIFSLFFTDFEMLDEHLFEKILWVLIHLTAHSSKIENKYLSKHSKISLFQPPIQE